MSLALAVFAITRVVEIRGRGAGRSAKKKATVARADVWPFSLICGNLVRRRLTPLALRCWMQLWAAVIVAQFS